MKKFKGTKYASVSNKSIAEVEVERIMREILEGKRGE